MTQETYSIMVSLHPCHTCKNHGEKVRKFVRFMVSNWGNIKLDPYLTPHTK